MNGQTIETAAELAEEFNTIGLTEANSLLLIDTWWEEGISKVFGRAIVGDDRGVNLVFIKLGRGLGDKLAANWPKGVSSSGFKAYLEFSPECVLNDFAELETELPCSEAKTLRLGVVRKIVCLYDIKYLARVAPNGIESVALRTVSAKFKRAAHDLLRTAASSAGGPNVFPTGLHHLATASDDLFPRASRNGFVQGQARKLLRRIEVELEGVDLSVI